MKRMMRCWRGLRRNTMKVNIEDLLALKKELNEINFQHLEDIEWDLDGELVEIPEKNIEEWKYIGLNNVDFITTEFYKEELDE